MSDASAKGTPAGILGGPPPWIGGGGCPPAPGRGGGGPPALTLGNFFFLKSEKISILNEETKTKEKNHLCSCSRAPLFGGIFRNFGSMCGE